MIARIRAEVGAASSAFGAVFRNPPLRNLALSWGAISIATWAFVIALAVYAFDYGGAAAVGVVALIRLLPGTIASPLAGLVSDKHSRKRVLVWSTALVTVILVAAGAVVLGDGPSAIVFVLAGLFTISSTPFLPAEAALMPLLAQTPRELAAANLIKNLMDNGGAIVSYMGDGIMAVFGAPLEQGDHADRAVEAAREMLGPRMSEFNEWAAGNKADSPFRMGVGINTGPVMAGQVGSEQRVEFAAIGDTTNTASRLESMTKESEYDLFISDSTREALVTRPSDLVEVGELEVRGRSEKVLIWSLSGEKEDPDDAAA